MLCDLTREEVVDLLTYNPWTGEFYWLHNGGRKVTKTIFGKRAGCLSREGYVVIRVNQRTYKAHRLAFLIMTGAWPTHQIDHKDLNRSNNVWRNLREATAAENAANRHRLRINTTGYKGVTRHPDGRFRAKIKIRGRDTHLGLFSTAEDAHACYQKANTAIRKEFARHN